MYKVRMATMYFKGDAKEWYKSYKIAKPEPPWPILIEEVMKYFSKVNSNPVADFRKIQQQGDVEEYIKHFSRAKARFMSQLGIVNEVFYKESFIGGLRDDIQNQIRLFHPPSLEDAFQIAKEIEVSPGTSSRRINSNLNYTQNPFIQTAKNSTGM